MKSSVIMYYGDGCPHCEKMMPVVKSVEKELDLKIIKKEVWNNDENKEEFKKLRGIAEECCGGLLIPTFYNPKNKKMICREQSEKQLIAFISST